MRLNLALIFVFIAFSLEAQKSTERGNIRIMFYNTENLFDTIDNPSTNDNEFLPGAEKKWNNYKYWSKLKHIYQVIAAAGVESPPEIIGLCEVESFLPLYNLTNNLPLQKYPYEIIHRDSPDERGIDVALLVRKDKLKIITTGFISVNFKGNTAKKTREILYAKLKDAIDTLHVFVNHWPSRIGGEYQSEKYRLQAAKTLAKTIDSLLKNSPGARIVVMGDFNDEPGNKSLQVLTKSGLINMASDYQKSYSCGSYKYRSQWYMYDQMLVSSAIIEGRGTNNDKPEFGVFHPEFLVKPDESYGGTKLFRTYQGPAYLGGFSDHLPVILDIF